MDQRLAAALETANIMATFNNQKRVLLEKFKLACVFYQSGGSFTVTKELITFVKTLVDTGNDTDVVLIDDNNVPILINNLNDFLSAILDVYFTASNGYITEFQKIKSARSVEKIIGL